MHTKAAIFTKLLTFLEVKVQQPLSYDYDYTHSCLPHYPTTTSPHPPSFLSTCALIFGSCTRNSYGCHGPPCVHSNGPVSVICHNCFFAPGNCSYGLSGQLLEEGKGVLDAKAYHWGCILPHVLIYLQKGHGDVIWTKKCKCVSLDCIFFLPY
jgi:hypothetical protein